METPLCETNLPGLARRQGKVRDLYELDAGLLLISTDRISAFDWVLPSGIPDKGRVLTQLSLFWFGRLGVPHHVITDDVAKMPLPEGTDRAPLAGRTLLCRKAEVVPIECVVRGYLAGSGWKDYQRTGAVCGVELPAGLTESERLPEPIFTPATKATSGHDENVSIEQAASLVGRDVMEDLKRRSLEAYGRAADYAAERGVLIADTKFEWGVADGEVLLVDEALTPDSSRFWDAESYEAGRPQDPFDKQLVRNWLEQSTWNKESPPPPLPDQIVQRTRAKYFEIFERLTGGPLGLAA